MYCSNCGVELQEGVKFCSNCGSKVEYAPSSVVNEIDETQENYEDVNERLEDEIFKSVHIFDNQFDVTYDMFGEANAKGIIRDVCETTTDSMIKYYYDLGNMTKVAKEIQEIGNYHLVGAAQLINGKLTELTKIGEVNIDSFRSNFYDFIGEWNDRVEEVLSLYNGLLNERNEFLDEIERKYRADVPNPNANLYMQEYYKNQYDAQIKEYNKAFKWAYELPETIESLKNIVNEIVWKIGYAFMDILEAKGLLERNIYNPDEIIYELSRISLTDNKCEAMYSLLQKSPDNPVLLNYAFASDIGDKQEIIEYCDLMDIKIVPTSKIADVEKLIMNTDYSNYLDISKSIDEVSYICSKYMIDGEKYINYLKEKLEIAAESAIVYDGILYSSLEEALKARKELTDILNQVSMIEENDREKMNEYIEILKNSTVDSNEKYITYLMNAVEKANENAKLVNGYMFDNEEEAERNKENIKCVYDKLNDIPEDSLDYLKECKSFTELNIDENVTSEIINRLNLYINIIEKCDEMSKSYSNCVFNTRYEYTLAMVEMEIYCRVLKKYNLKHKKIVEVYENRLRDFKNVYGTIAKDVDEAIKEYVNCVKHAINYKKSLEESQSPKKKGLFGNLKATVKGLWNSQYELEYNRVTQNGQRELPNETDESLQKINQLYGESSRQCVDFNSLFRKCEVKDPYSYEKKYLNMNELFVHNKNEPEAFPINEISKILTGTVVEVKTISNSNFEPADTVHNHIATIDQYQFITFGERYIPEWFKDTKKYYCAIYTDVSSIRESMTYLKEKKIPCEIKKYRIQF